MGQWEETPGNTDPSPSSALDPMPSDKLRVLSHLRLLLAVKRKALMTVFYCSYFFPTPVPILRGLIPTLRAQPVCGKGFSRG